MLRSGNVREMLRIGFSLCLTGREAQPRLLLPLQLLVWCLQGGTIRLLLLQMLLLLVFKQFLPQWCISSRAPLPLLLGERLHPYVPFPGGAGIHPQHLLRAQSSFSSPGWAGRVGQELVPVSAADLLHA